MGTIILILIILGFITFPIVTILLFKYTVGKFIRALKDRKNNVESYNAMQLIKSIVLLILSLILVLTALYFIILLILLFTGVIPFM